MHAIGVFIDYSSYAIALEGCCCYGNKLLPVTDLQLLQ